MKNRFIQNSIILLISVGVFCSCLDGKKTEVRHTVAEEATVSDSSLLVKLVGMDQQNIHVTILKNQTNKSFNFSEAKSNGMVKGDLRQGDTLSIYPDENNGTIRSLINISELVGTWYYDMKNNRGFKLAHEGALSSINMENINFHNWRVKNGELVIHYVDMQQLAANESSFWSEHAHIEKLSKDELDIRFRDTLMHCQHLKEVIKFKF